MAAKYLVTNRRPTTCNNSPTTKSNLGTSKTHLSQARVLRVKLTLTTTKIRCLKISSHSKIDKWVTLEEISTKHTTRTQALKLIINFNQWITLRIINSKISTETCKDKIREIRKHSIIPSRLHSTKLSTPTSNTTRATSKLCKMHKTWVQISLRIACKNHLSRTPLKTHNSSTKLTQNKISNSICQSRCTPSNKRTL